MEMFVFLLDVISFLWEKDFNCIIVFAIFVGVKGYANSSSTGTSSIGIYRLAGLLDCWKCT